MRLNQIPSNPSGLLKPGCFTCKYDNKTNTRDSLGSTPGPSYLLELFFELLLEFIKKAQSQGVTRTNVEYFRCL